jgi:hypothetical protein
MLPGKTIRREKANSSGSLFSASQLGSEIHGPYPPIVIIDF